jgi:hypothetical protein
VSRESADELMIRRFAGARRDGIGRPGERAVGRGLRPHTRSSVTRLGR